MMQLFRSINTFFNRVRGRFQRGQVTATTYSSEKSSSATASSPSSNSKAPWTCSAKPWCKKGGGAPGSVIVEQGFASEADIIRTINAEYQIEVTSLADDIRSGFP